MPDINRHRGHDRKELVNSIDEISDKLSYFDLPILTKASGILESIIYDNKDKDWYSYFLVLFSYIDWLYAHSVNTALISCMLGISLDFDDKRLAQLAEGALFHDIGMTLLPKKVLNKSEKLTDMELAIVKNHCDMGYAMLEPSSLDETSKLIILQHHEKIDGTGYPNQLTDNQILEEAKIVMVAESFDTATTTRPYKKSKPADVVLDELISFPKIYPKYIVDNLKRFVKGL